MPNSYRSKYSELSDFILAHPEIKIEACQVSIPDSIRPRFYQVFDAVTTAFIEEKLPDISCEAMLLSQNYLKAEQEVLGRLSLDGVSMDAGLHRFLRCPIEKLGDGLFNDLFDLLKGKTDFKAFEETALLDAPVLSMNLFQAGYDRWVALSMIKLAEANILFHTPLQEMGIYDAAKIGHTIEDQVIAPEESKHLSLDFKPTVFFNIPDFIVYSAKIKKYLSLRYFGPRGDSTMSKVSISFGVATNASKKREWYSLGILENKYESWWKGLNFIAIFIGDSPEELALVADAKVVCRPDLIIKCIQKERQQDELESIIFHHNAFKPRLGTFVILSEATPGQTLSTQEKGINILDVGFDQFKLEPIFDAAISV